MKITICGSIAFYEEMLCVKSKLEKMSHQVEIPPSEIKDEIGNLISVENYYKLRQNTNNPAPWIWERKKEAMINHFKKVDWSDAILVLNYNKNNIEGYIGSNTLMEMGLALYLNKGIYLLNPIPEIAYKEEILGTQSIILNRDLTKCKKKI